LCFQEIVPLIDPGAAARECVRNVLQMLQ
jgi:hypothetical protein